MRAGGVEENAEEEKYVQYVKGISEEGKKTLLQKD